MRRVRWTRASEFFEYAAPQIGYCKFFRGQPRSESKPLEELASESLQENQELALVAKQDISQGTLLIHTVPLVVSHSPIKHWLRLAVLAELAIKESKLSAQQKLYLSLLQPRKGTIAEKVLCNALCCNPGKTSRQGEFQQVLMSLASFIDHSCLPNCNLEWAAGWITIQARSDIPAGTLITLSYIPFPIDMISSRQQLIGDQFLCQCEACTKGLLPSVHAMNLIGVLEDANGCWRCGRPGKLQRCGKCKRAYYCSIACQKKAFSTHQTLCQPALE